MTVPFAFRKSSYSNAVEECVEVAATVTGAVEVRDSKDPEGPTLTFGPAAWDAFLATVRGGRLPI